METRTQQTLDRLKELLDSGDTDRMLVGAGRLLDGILLEFSSHVSTLRQVPTLGVDLLLRCVLCKTSEYWSAVLELIECDRAHAAVSLLRPMCEELVFAKFIGQMPVDEADEFIRQKGRLELLDNVLAQERFFPAMRSEFSFSDLPARAVNEALIADVSAAARRQADSLRGLAERLGWGKKPHPTVRHMAHVTGLEPYYDFIYRATSSAVHASVQRFGRMVWDNPETGEFTVTSATFEQYFRRFSLVYGGWIAAFTASEMAIRFRSDFPSGANDSLSIIMAFFIKPAVANEGPKLVTPEELRWRGSGT
jgi:hypothetical protein